MPIAPSLENRACDRPRFGREVASVGRGHIAAQPGTGRDRRVIIDDVVQPVATCDAMAIEKERIALVAIGHGGDKIGIGFGKSVGEPPTPCGICLQRFPPLLQFAIVGLSYTYQ